MGCGASTQSGQPIPDPAGKAYALSEANVRAADENNGDIATGGFMNRKQSVSEMSTVGALPERFAAKMASAEEEGAEEDGACAELPQPGMFKTKTIDANGKVIQIQTSPAKSKKYVNPIIARKTSASTAHLERQLADFNKFNASGKCAITKNSSAPSLSISAEETIDEEAPRRASITGAGPLSLGAMGAMGDESANVAAAAAAAVPALVEEEEEEEEP